jgi:hypothetical protein
MTSVERGSRCQNKERHGSTRLANLPIQMAAFALNLGGNRSGNRYGMGNAPHSDQKRANF